MKQYSNDEIPTTHNDGQPTKDHDEKYKLSLPDDAAIVRAYDFWRQRFAGNPDKDRVSHAGKTPDEDPEISRDHDVLSSVGRALGLPAGASEPPLMWPARDFESMNRHDRRPASRMRDHELIHEAFWLTSMSRESKMRDHELIREAFALALTRPSTPRRRQRDG